MAGLEPALTFYGPTDVGPPIYALESLRCRFVATSGWFADRHLVGMPTLKIVCSCDACAL
jgi:hypothetical protein